MMRHRRIPVFPAALFLGVVLLPAGCGEPVPAQRTAPVERRESRPEPVKEPAGELPEVPTPPVNSVEPAPAPEPAPEPLKREHPAD